MSLEPVLTREQQSGAQFVTSDGTKIWVVWRFEKKGQAMVGLTDLRMLGDEWADLGGHAWPAEAAAGAAAAIVELAAKNPPPPLSEADAKLQAREPESSPTSTWVLPISKTAKLLVFSTVYDGKPSVMIRRYVRKKATWNYDSYAVLDLASATKIAGYLLQGDQLSSR
ncbi:MAG: hypothetical protein QM765_30635 [Myxococcales bacterium]